MKNYKYLLIIYNDIDEAIQCLRSLRESEGRSISDLVEIVDGGTTEENWERFLVKYDECPKEEITTLIRKFYLTPKYPDLSVCLNAGYYKLLGYNPDGSNIKEFISSGKADTDYIFWIHTDMRFPEKNWASKLIWCYDYLWPLVGKLGPSTKNIDGSTLDVPLRGGNQCPHLMSSKFIREYLEEFGELFNPMFKGIGGYEDWYQKAQIIQLGYECCITSLVDVWHKGMGTRAKFDTVKDQRNNGHIYYKLTGMTREKSGGGDFTTEGLRLKEAFFKCKEEDFL